MERTDCLRVWVDVKSPVTPKQLSEINDNIGSVQFNRALTERDHKQLAERLRQFPEVSLRVFELFGTPERNLDFLKHYPGLKRLSADLYHLQSIDGIHHITGSLEYLSLGKTEAKISLDFLTKCGRLKGLFLEEHVNGIEKISTLRKLNDLTLRSITLPDLEIVAALPELWSLDLKLGGTTNLAALARMKTLKYLELWMVKKLSDISVISDVTSLQHIFLESLRNVTSIPPLDKLRGLRRIRLRNMKGIKDLSPLLGGKSLEDAIIAGAAHLTPEAFLPLQKHASLKAIGFGLGSNKKNQAVAALFPGLQHTIKYPFIYR